MGTIVVSYKKNRNDFSLETLPAERWQEVWLNLAGNVPFWVQISRVESSPCGSTGGKAPSLQVRILGSGWRMETRYIFLGLQKKLDEESWISNFYH